MRTRWLLPMLGLGLLACRQDAAVDSRSNPSAPGDASTWPDTDGGPPEVPPIGAEAGVESGIDGGAEDAGHDAGSPKPECTHDLGCPGGICETKQCVESQCSTGAECADTQTCRAGRCVPLGCGGHHFVYDPKGRTLTSVAVAGTFNGWDKDSASAQLSFDAQTQTWRGRLEVGEGSHEYKLVVNGSEWLLDPSNPEQTSTDGSANSKLLIDCPFACQADTSEFDWRDSVLYFAMLDRFRDGDGKGSAPAAGGDAQNPRSGYGGGDLMGLTDKLPYLSDLGVSALWITSPARNLQGGYHGYWPAPENIDYSDPDHPSPVPAIDARVGSDAQLRNLVQAAHQSKSAQGHGIKVLFDYVMKHAADTSPLAMSHGDWFYRENGKVKECSNGTPDEPEDDVWNDPFWKTRCGFNGFLPPFDFDASTAARNWSVSDAVYWATDMKLDGYRLDAIKHVPKSWLAELRQRLWDKIPAPAGGRFMLIGETFDFTRDALKSLIEPGTLLDGQFDFPMRAKLCEASLTRTLPMSELAIWLEQNDRYYGERAIMTTWLGNHDVPRPIHLASGQLSNCYEGSHAKNSLPAQFAQPQDAAAYERLAVAFALQFASPGIPMIYYGDEVGLAGGGDPENRRMLPWDDSVLSAPQRILRDKVRALARLRAKVRVLSRGERKTIHSDADSWLFEMRGCEPTLSNVLVAINRGDAEKNVTLPAGDYEDLLGSSANRAGTVSLKPRSYLFLKLR